MEEIKSVNIVFIGRGDMLKQLCGAERGSNFAVASVTYRGLVVERTPSISSVVGEDTISKADKVFILCSTEKELNEYIQKISHLPITSKFVVMAPDKVKKDGFIRKIKDPSLKSALSAVPFTGTLLKDLQPKLLELYSQHTHELIQQKYQESLADQKRQRDERASPSREHARTNPNADLPEKQRAIEASAAALVELAQQIKNSDDKEFVDREIEGLKVLKKQFDQKVEEYTQRISQTDGDLRAQLEAPLIASSDEVKAEMEAAVAVQKALDDRIAEAERLERELREAEDAAAAARHERLAKLQETKILSSVFFHVQREVELNSIEDYVVSVNFAGESQNSDVMCVVFNPTLPNCENHLREAIEGIKVAQRLNQSVRAVFLRAETYDATGSRIAPAGYEEFNAASEKETDERMISDLGVENPVIVDNLRDFKDKAGYGHPVVFRKVEEGDVERVDVGDGFESVGGAESPQELPELSVVNESKKNPYRWSFKYFKHARFERKENLNTYFDSHGPDKSKQVDLDWIELNKLSMYGSRELAQLIKDKVDSQLSSRPVKVDQDRYKVVFELLAFLDKEERRIKPKVITFFANANYSEKYIAKRKEQRDLIYTTAKAIYDRLKANPDVNEVLENAGDILDGLSVKGKTDGHVVKGIKKIIENEKNRVQQQVRAER